MRKGLQRNAIGLVQGIVLGLSGTAPSYSLAASLGLIVVAAGIQSPAVVLLAFIPTLFVAIACQQLNRAMPDCGVSFTWCAAAFGPATGWLAGWAVIVTDVVVMANLGQVAGQYTFLLLGLEELSQSTLWTTLCGVLLIAVSTWLCYRGIRLSVRTQCVLLSFEVMALAAFAAAALVRVYRGSAPAGFMRPDWSWFDPFAIRSPAALGEGVLLAVFIYWGWDSVLAMNEESSDSDRTPGIAAVLSTVLLLATYLLVTVAAQAYAGVGAAGLGLANPRNAADVLAALSHAVLGRGIAGQLIIVSTVTSVAASMQTTILPTARIMLSMASGGALPALFARTHPRYCTPTVATITVAAVAVLYYVGLTAVSGAVLADSLKSISLAIAFYYALTAFACVWYFRRTLLHRTRWLLLRGVLPLAGGLALMVALLGSADQMLSVRYGETSFAGIGGVFLLGIGPLALGILLMAACRRALPAWFAVPPRVHAEGADRA